METDDGRTLNRSLKQYIIRNFDNSGSANTLIEVAPQVKLGFSPTLKNQEKLIIMENNLENASDNSILQAFRKPAIQYLLMFLSVMVVYLPTLWYTYVWDDVGAITGNLSIRKWSNIPSFFTDPQTFGKDPGVPHALAWRPVRNLYYLVTYKIHGLHPAGWHLNHILIHCLAATMLLAVMHRLFRYRINLTSSLELPAYLQISCWFATLTWAVHPANLEVTAWLKSADDILSCIFSFGCLLMLFPNGKPLSNFRVIFAIILFALALLSKESVAPFPAIYCGLLIILSPGLSKTLHHKPTITAVILLFATVLGYLALRTALLGKLEQVPYMAGNFSLMMATMTTAIVRYLQMTFWPFWPTMQIGDYAGWPIAASWLDLRVLYSIAIIIAFGIFTIAVARRNRMFTAGAVFTLLAFSPIANVIPMMQVMAERFMYFPLIGVSIALAGLYSGWLKSGNSKRVWLPAVIAIALGMTTLKNMPTWLDDISFQEHNIEAFPNNHRAHYNLGVLQFRAGHTTASAKHLIKSMQLKPNVECGILTVRALQKLNETTSTMKYLNNMIRDFPEAPKPLFFKAEIMRERGETTQALLLYNKVLKLFKTDPGVYYNRAVAYDQLGSKSEALKDLDTVLSLDSNHSSAALLKAKLKK